MTASHSSRLILWKNRSRRMPALLTTPSMRPKLSTAHCTMRAALAASATLSVLATAWPPAALISSTTFCAGPASVPSPVVEVPMSLTTTLAPSAAMASAMSRPMPPPAPVTTTTLSCIIFCAMACRSRSVFVAKKSEPSMPANAGPRHSAIARADFAGMKAAAASMRQPSLQRGQRHA
ncbi:hypothetical protein SDC9_146781 [bioreactor metagenome]|uniref:Uncharacterized protein n=1 Tax=bioreactor metagenome TaxID=1076179 RepID=A0A645EE24_9ZZZZ